jgi:anthranilate/para-aminobenzoate synthase component I
MTSILITEESQSILSDSEVLTRGVQNQYNSIVSEQRADGNLLWFFLDPLASVDFSVCSSVESRVALEEFLNWVDGVSSTLRQPIPFCAGYIAYEAFLGLGVADRFSSSREFRARQSDGCFVIYQRVLCVADGLVTDYRLAYDNVPSWLRPIVLEEAVEYNPQATTLPNEYARYLRSNLDVSDAQQLLALSGVTSRDDHVAKCDHIKAMIRSGEVYQVNLSLALDIPWDVSEVPLLALASAFLRMTGANRKAWLSLPFNNNSTKTIISASPELFFSRHHRDITCKPIKGTRPRYSDPSKDSEEQVSLLASSKDRAELAMIVDLVRNDLHRVCEVGSVVVAKHFELETHEAVHHTVSDVIGKLRENVSYVELFKALFPCGSITGAPKIAALEVIEDLEPHQRDCYCGAIGYFGGQHHAHFNVGIRTLRIHDGRVTTWAGSGITIDSDSNQEFDEALVKLLPALRLLASAVTATPD